METGIAAAITSLTLASIAATCSSNAASIGISVYSVVDAVRVAKVKNMYGQDLQNGMAGKFDVELSPSFAILPSAEGSIQTTGLALRISFYE